MKKWVTFIVVKQDSNISCDLVLIYAFFRFATKAPFHRVSESPTQMDKMTWSVKRGRKFKARILVSPFVFTLTRCLTCFGRLSSPRLLSSPSPGRVGPVPMTFPLTSFSLLEQDSQPAAEWIYASGLGAGFKLLLTIFLLHHSPRGEPACVITVQDLPRLWLWASIIASRNYFLRSQGGHMWPSFSFSSLFWRTQTWRV